MWRAWARGSISMTTKPIGSESAVKQMLALLTDDGPPDLSVPLAFWLATSKAFFQFAQSYLPKIRKKARLARDAEERYNLYCELRTAYLLLQEPKFTVEYEPYRKEQGRSPDFAVSYRTHLALHVEVTRLRHLPDAAADRRLVDVVCDKVGQLASSTPNVLWVWGEQTLAQEVDLAQLLPDLKRRVEQRDAGLLARHNLRVPADFLRNYQRLSVVVVQSVQGAENHAQVWANPAAKLPLPAKLRSRLGTLIAADPSPDFGSPSQT